MFQKHGDVSASLLMHPFDSKESPLLIREESGRPLLRSRLKVDRRKELV